MKRLLAQLPGAIRLWEERDPVMARLARTNPPAPSSDHRGSGFHSLATSLLHQQVSLAAGRSITRRLRRACGGRLTPARLLRRSVKELRAAGVSRQKASYLRDLAARVDSGRLDFRRLRGASDAAVIEALTAVKGIGPWTAKMFLLFHLERPDVVAPEDLGLRLAVSDAYGVRMDRTARFLERNADRWSPHGSLACLTLWAHKDAQKSGARKDGPSA